MSLGCYIISKKEIIINKEAVKDKSHYFSPENLIIDEDSVFIYGDEDENQLIQKILSVEGVHRSGVFILIFSTLNVYHKGRVKNTLNKLKKVDKDTYEEVKHLLEKGKKSTENSTSINRPLTQKECTNCGHKITLENNFCTNCGCKVDAKQSKFETPKYLKSNPSTTQNDRVVELSQNNNKKDVLKRPKKDGVLAAFIIVGLVIFVVLAGIFDWRLDSNLQNSQATNEDSRIFETVTLINESSDGINVSIGFKNSDKDYFAKGSQGWFSIEPDESKVINLLTELGDDKYYNSGDLWLYAESYSEDFVFQGKGDDYDNSDFWINDKDGFNLKLYWKPAEDNKLSLKTFYRIQLEGQNTNHTFTD
jgi:hypothetical protein